MVSLIHRIPPPPPPPLPPVLPQDNKGPDAHVYIQLSIPKSVFISQISSQPLS